MPQVTIHAPDDLKWTSVIEGAEMAVLSGDPTRAGDPYVIRFRTQREIDVPMHWHRCEEPITVLEGALRLALEDAPEYRSLAAGSYVVIPAGMRHRTVYGPGTVIQTSGMGPFESIYTDPATDLGDRIR